MKTYKAKTDRTEMEINSSTIIVREFNIPFSIIDRKIRQKISKVIENGTMK